ncbi:MAG: ECF-type sigma factor, partial [Myxococcota bacterium]
MNPRYSDHMSTSGEVTRLLLAFRDGDRDAFDHLVPLLYEDLRRIARAHIRRSDPSQTLSATALVHEAYVRLVDQTQAEWSDRNHFLSVCSVVMRRIVVSSARKRAAAKRGGDKKVTLDEARIPADTDAERMLELNQALERLGARDERLVRVVECRFFAGLTEQDTASALDSSLRTVQRDWKRARAWLKEELGGLPAAPGPRELSA